MSHLFALISAVTLVITGASFALATRRSGFGSVSVPSQVAARASDVVLALVLVHTFTPWTSIPVGVWLAAMAAAGLIAGHALRRSVGPWDQPGWGRRRDVVHVACSLAAGAALALL